MITTLLSDFSYVLLFPKTSGYDGGLNQLHQMLSVDGTYDFHDHFVFNQKLLDFYKYLKSHKMVSPNVFTSGSIQDHPQSREILNSIFDNIFSASELGFVKSDPSSYGNILKSLGARGEDTIFIDDSPKNIEAAGIAGLQVVRFVNTDQAIKTIESMMGKGI